MARRVRYERLPSLKDEAEDKSLLICSPPLHRHDPSVEGLLHIPTHLPHLDSNHYEELAMHWKAFSRHLPIHLKNT